VWRPIRNSCLPAACAEFPVEPRYEQRCRKADPGSDLGGGGLPGYERSNRSGVGALVSELMRAAFCFAGPTSDGDVFCCGPRAVNPSTRRKKRNVNRWLCVQPVAFITHS